MTLLQLVYTSRATERFNDRDLPSLVATARTHNDRVGITGALHFSDGRFIQVLEGAETDVVSLYEIFVTDPRHTEVETVSRRIVGERGFGEWRMGHLPRGLVINAGRDALRVSRTPVAGWDDTEVDAILTEFRRALVSSSGV